MPKIILSVIVPVYNEEKTLSKIIEKVINAEIRGVSKEIIIINDGSSDNSEKIIRELEKKYQNICHYNHNKNKGKGEAIRTAIKHIKGDIVVIQDGDLEYNPSDFNKMIIPIINNETQVVYGSRMLGKITGFNISSHYYGNVFLSFITNLLYNQKITDMETCYKMMRTNILKSLNLKSKRFNIEPEITAKIIKKKYKIIEIPINYNSRSFIEGKKIDWKDGIHALFSLIKYRFFD